jgi:hypothetical protein
VGAQIFVNRASGWLFHSSQWSLNASGSSQKRFAGTILSPQLMKFTLLE